MKFSRFFLVLLIFAAAVTAAFTILGDSEVGVTVSRVKQQEYSPYILLSGSISETDYVEASTGAVKTDAMLVTAVVSESKISSVREGQKAEITGDGFENKSYTAYVSSIGKSAKKVTVGSSKVVVVDVVLEIENPDDALKSGFTAKVRLFTDEAQNVIVVPYSAVLQDDGGEYVYVYNDGKAVRRNIKTGRELENGFEAVSGLDAGSIVITSPLDISGDSAPVYAKKLEG